MLALAIAGCRVRSTDAAGDDAGDDAAEADVPSVQRGYLAVQARRCGQCHQSDDPSAGVLSGQTTPVPMTQAYGSNLTPDPDTGMDAWDAATIATSILHAVDQEGKPLCPAMPGYADAGMTADEALSIAAYLQSLAPVWHPVPASTCPPVKSSGADGG
jgi:mono/diheme cytochrome c family protein